MAGQHFITEGTGAIPGPFGLPRLIVPSNYAASDIYPVVFQLQTPAGVVDVRGNRQWICVGSAAALLAAGIIREDWLPGRPGNNKTRQTIVFDSPAPRLLVGNRRGRRKLEAPHLVISRKSRTSFEVVLPPTTDQKKMLAFAGEDLMRREDAAKIAKREAEENALAHERSIKRKELPANAIREECARYARSCSSLITGCLQSGGFRADAGMARRLEEVFADLDRCISEGVLRPIFDEVDGVIPLRRIQPR